MVSFVSCASNSSQSLRKQNSVETISQLCTFNENTVGTTATCSMKTSSLMTQNNFVLKLNFPENKNTSNKQIHSIETWFPEKQCNIKYFPSNIFVDYVNLESVKFWSCNLQEFKLQQKMKKPSKLVSLMLDTNSLQYLDKKTMTQFPKLESLSLTFNAFKKIANNFLSKNSELTALYLGYNAIETIEINAFRGLKKLKKLFLAANKLKKIQNNLFVDNQNLQRLSFEDNLITIVEKNAFKNLKKLTHLVLTGNLLVKFSFDLNAFFKTMPNLKLFLIGNNKFDCNYLPALVNATEARRIVNLESNVTKTTRNFKGIDCV